LSTPAQVWQYRTLIGNLAQRDLKSRYKKSVLGWLWSLINPAVTLGIYTVVFGVFLGAQAPVAGNGTTQNFALFLFCGLVAWNFFSGTVNTLIGNFAGAGGLLTRTYFPPECPMVSGLITTGLGNIRFRDVGYLVGIGLQALFYATPIVYPFDIVPQGFQLVLRLNPLTHFVDGMRHAFYTLDTPTATNWLMMVGSAAVSLGFGWWIFSVNAPKVIEEL
jgi:ABC-2 type transport system permease protein